MLLLLRGAHGDPDACSWRPLYTCKATELKSGVDRWQLPQKLFGAPAFGGHAHGWHRASFILTPDDNRCLLNIGWAPPSDPSAEGAGTATGTPLVLTAASTEPACSTPFSQQRFNGMGGLGGLDGSPGRHIKLC